MDQGGSLLSDAHLDVETYLQLLHERADELLDEGHDGAHSRSVAASWAVAFDQLTADDPATLDLLALITWCGPKPVPLILLTENPAPLPGRLRDVVVDPLALSTCTRLLHRRGLVILAPHSLHLHRVPAALLRARTSTDTESWPTVVIHLLRAALPGALWNNPEVWPLWQLLLPHVLAAVAVDRPLDTATGDLSWLLDHAGTYRHTRGDPHVP